MVLASWHPCQQMPVCCGAPLSLLWVSTVGTKVSPLLVFLRVQSSLSPFILTFQTHFELSHIWRKILSKVLTLRFIWARLSMRWWPCVPGKQTAIVDSKFPVLASRAQHVAWFPIVCLQQNLNWIENCPFWKAFVKMSLVMFLHLKHVFTHFLYKLFLIVLQELLMD